VGGYVGDRENRLIFHQVDEREHGGELLRYASVTHCYLAEARAASTRVAYRSKVFIIGASVFFTICEGAA
jgi:hypothetical protein